MAMKTSDLIFLQIVYFAGAYSVWWSEVVQTLDCGNEAAAWFSTYILGKDTGARLGYYLQESPAFRRDISKVKLTAFQQHYKKLHDRDVVSFHRATLETPSDVILFILTQM
jgi:hypothetical protein